MRYVAVLSLVWLSVSTQPVQGKGLKAIKGKVSDVAARWMSRAVALPLGASLLFAPLANVDAAGAGTQDRPVVQDQSHAPIKADRARLRTDFRLAAAEAARMTDQQLKDAMEALGVLDADMAARMTDQQLKDEMEALGVGVTVDKRGEQTHPRTNPPSSPISPPKNSEQTHPRTNPHVPVDILALSYERGLTRPRTNPYLLDDFYRYNVFGEMRNTRTDPYADLLPISEGGESLRLLMILTHLGVIDERALFGSALGRRVAGVWSIDDMNKIPVKPELREYFFKSWLDLVRNELVQDTLVSRAVQLDVLVPQEFVASASRSAAARKIKLAVTNHRNLLNKLLQGDLSLEEYERDYAGIKEKIFSAERESYGVIRASRADSPHIGTGW